MVGQRVYGKLLYLLLICCEPKIALNNKVYKKKEEEEEALFREKVASDAGEAEPDCFSLLFSLLMCFVLVVSSWPGLYHRSRSLL